MDTAQVQPEASRPPVPMQMYAALIKLISQPALKPLHIPGKHIRSGFTKNKFQGESKARRMMAKASRARNRGR